MFEKQMGIPFLMISSILLDRWKNLAKNFLAESGASPRPYVEVIKTTGVLLTTAVFSLNMWLVNFKFLHNLHGIAFVFVTVWGLHKLPCWSLFRTQIVLKNDTASFVKTLFPYGFLLVLFWFSLGFHTALLYYYVLFDLFCAVFLALSYDVPSLLFSCGVSDGFPTVS